MNLDDNIVLKDITKFSTIEAEEAAMVLRYFLTKNYFRKESCLPGMYE